MFDCGHAPSQKVTLSATERKCLTCGVVEDTVDGWIFCRSCAGLVSGDPEEDPYICPGCRNRGKGGQLSVGDFAEGKP